jgi:DNA-binding NtrC family response regulator
MSYEIITKSLKGKLYARNTKYGAKFFIELPIKKDTDYKIDKKLLKTIKILYVEDEDLIRDSVEEALSKFVKEIVVVENGKKGLFKFNELNDFDLIITDILMPEMNGIEMIKEIRNINKDIPIIVTSAYGLTNSYVKELYRMDNLKYTMKPIIFKNLFMIIKEMIK